MTIKAAREAAGLTQDQLAELARCSRATVTKLETGARAPSTAAGRRVCAVLGIEPPPSPRRTHTVHAEVSEEAWLSWASWPYGERGARLSALLEAAEPSA